MIRRAWHFVNDLTPSRNYAIISRCKQLQGVIVAKVRQSSEELLRALGLRPSPQRMLILQAILDNDGHLTAEEIYKKVRAQYPPMDISTVYRTLELLKDRHALCVTDLGQGRIVYELLTEARHHHLVCLHCGRIMDFDHALLEPLESALKRDHDFQARIDHFAVFGLCTNCQGEEREVG